MRQCLVRTLRIIVLVPPCIFSKTRRCENFECKKKSRRTMTVSGMIANASASCFVEFDAKISISGDTAVLSDRLFVYCYLSLHLISAWMLLDELLSGHGNFKAACAISVNTIVVKFLLVKGFPGSIDFMFPLVFQ